MLIPVFVSVSANLNFFSQRELIPVSYTHLDVYKRQNADSFLQRQVIVVFSEVWKLHALCYIVGQIAGWLGVRYLSGICRLLYRGGFRPVSYTHLDVYKRQARVVSLAFSTRRSFPSASSMVSRCV